ncbi:3-dehydroquinate synthase [Candidatus Gottesmanbacteria bacterium]|nr:3-dehydroquinate synthase [Candidatus Gottesmanbacteria bacterium]
MKITSVVHVGDQLLTRIPSLCNMTSCSRAVILTDAHVPVRFVRTVKTSLSMPVTTMTIPSGETSKSIEMLSKIWKHLLRAGCDRRSVVINVGGGVVCDLGGFAAATYKRGIDWINVPTTLLSQVDAAIGGKTGIDFSGVKNLVGIIRQPKAIIIDVETLSTLPQRQFISGFAEIIKHGLIGNAAYFRRVTRKKPEAFTRTELIDIISASIRIKNTIVKNDPDETGRRKILNFGHTIGHAVEALSQRTDAPLTHGEAVAIGIAGEALLSVRAGLLSAKDCNAIRAVLENASLPTTLPLFSRDRLLELMSADKKNSDNTIRWVLLTHIGRALWDRSVDNTTLRNVLAEAQNI